MTSRRSAGRGAARLGLAGWTGGLAMAWWAVGRLAAPLPPPPLHGLAALQTWADSLGPAAAAASALRLVVIAGLTYVSAIAALVVLDALVSLPSSLRLERRLGAASLRTLVDRALGVGMATMSLAAPLRGPTTGGTTPGVVHEVELIGASSASSSLAPSRDAGPSRPVPSGSAAMVAAPGTPPLPRARPDSTSSIAVMTARPMEAGSAPLPPQRGPTATMTAGSDERDPGAPAATMAASPRGPDAAAGGGRASATAGIEPAGPPPTITAEAPAGGDTLPTRAGPPTSVPAPHPATWTVRPGDHLWSIAESIVEADAGRSPDEGEIARYWRRLILSNKASLVDPDNPDLIFPGQVLDLPDH